MREVVEDIFFPSGTAALRYRAHAPFPIDKRCRIWYNVNSDPAGYLPDRMIGKLACTDCLFRTICGADG